MVFGKGTLPVDSVPSVELYMSVVLIELIDGEEFPRELMKIVEVELIEIKDDAAQDVAARRR